MTITNPYFIYKYILNSFQMKQEPSYYRSSELTKLKLMKTSTFNERDYFSKNDSFHFWNFVLIPLDCTLFDIVDKFLVSLRCLLKPSFSWGFNKIFHTWYIYSKMIHAPSPFVNFYFFTYRSLTFPFDLLQYLNVLGFQSSCKPSPFGKPRIPNPVVFQIFPWKT